MIWLLKLLTGDAGKYIATLGLAAALAVFARGWFTRSYVPAAEHRVQVHDLTAAIATHQQRLDQILRQHAQDKRLLDEARANAEQRQRAAEATTARLRRGARATPAATAWADTVVGADVDELLASATAPATARSGQAQPAE